MVIVGLAPGFAPPQSDVPPCATANTEKNLFIVHVVVVVPLLGYPRATGRPTRLRERQTPSEEGALAPAPAAPLAATSAPRHVPLSASGTFRTLPHHELTAGVFFLFLVQ